MIALFINKIIWEIGFVVIIILNQTIRIQKRFTKNTIYKFLIFIFNSKSKLK